jgi:hypothetical protein
VPYVIIFRDGQGYVSPLPSGPVRWSRRPTCRSRAS